MFPEPLQCGEERRREDLLEDQDDAVSMEKRGPLLWILIFLRRQPLLLLGIGFRSVWIGLLGHHLQGGAQRLGDLLSERGLLANPCWEKVTAPSVPQLQIRQVGFSPDRGVKHLGQVLFMHSRRMASAVCKVVKPIPDFFVLCR